MSTAQICASLALPQKAVKDLFKRRGIYTVERLKPEAIAARWKRGHAPHALLWLTNRRKKKPGKCGRSHKP